MPKFQDLSGKKFNRWTIVYRVPSINKRTLYLCKCDCGVERIVQGKHVKEGSSKSCGCLCLEINAKRLQGNKLRYKHGLEKHPLRAIWKSMLDRCKNDKNRFYKNYGGRGISVCALWEESLLSFYDWALANGWEKGLSIDRIDNDGNYDPRNCRWITVSENSRRTKFRIINSSI